MKQVLEIKRIEERKDEKELFCIKIHNEGGWYRCYEWSAYLAHMYKNESNQQLKLNKNFYKNITEGLLSVGIPAASLKKYLDVTEKDLIPIEEEDNVFLLDVRDKFEKDRFTIENYIEKLNEVKESIPFETKKSKTVEISKVKETNNNQINTSNDFTKNLFRNICFEILRYPIEKAKTEENALFIRKIKDDISLCLSSFL